MTANNEAKSSPAQKDRERKKKCCFQSFRAIYTFNLNKNCLRNNWTKLTCRNVCSYIQPSEALKVDTTRPTWGGSSSESATLPATHPHTHSLSINHACRKGKHGMRRRQVFKYHHHLCMHSSSPSSLSSCMKNKSS